MSGLWLGLKPNWPDMRKNNKESIKLHKKISNETAASREFKRSYLQG